MMTPDYSREAHEPPETNPEEPDRIIPCKQRKNEELPWAPRHGPEDVAERTEPPPPGLPGSSMPPEPVAQAVLRKTELYDRPPLFRSEEPQFRQKIIPDLQDSGAEVPYGLFEGALRDLMRSMIRRQETIGQGLATEVEHLDDRLDILEDRIELTIDRMDRRICSLEEERGS